MRNERKASFRKVAEVGQSFATCGGPNTDFCKWQYHISLNNLTVSLVFRIARF